MILAAFETSTAEGSVALLLPGGGLEKLLPAGSPHSETLLPALLALLAEAGVARERVQALAVGIGPGAFTGLRVGLASAQGWAAAAGTLLVAVPSIDALAEPVLAGGGAALTLCDARKGEVYAAYYPGLDSGGLPGREGEVALLAPHALRAWWDAVRTDSRGAAALAVGNAVAAARPCLEGAPGLGFSPGGQVPRALAVARLGARLLSAGRTVAPAGLLPYYVRPPDAVPPVR
jgi:tRNA threonylcarbamoyladenosine biosynthesis protein TsaB